MSSLVFSCVLWLLVYFWTVAFFVARTLVNDFLLWFQLYLKEYDVIITRKQKRGQKNNPHASATRTIPKRLHPLLIADYPQEKRCNFIHFTFFVWPNRTKTVQAYNGNFFYYSVFLWCARALNKNVNFAQIENKKEKNRKKSTYNAQKNFAIISPFICVSIHWQF